ncbi:hypothetical protein [Paenibacillus sp. 2TAB19]|uniref:hypothetical protein n=1 Tax=Paenibacillus sp. 2TAB19 TaxID=3233003 RepID=UPI003F9D5761
MTNRSRFWMKVIIVIEIIMCLLVILSYNITPSDQIIFVGLMPEYWLFPALIVFFIIALIFTPAIFKTKRVRVKILFACIPIVAAVMAYNFCEMFNEGVLHPITIKEENLELIATVKFNYPTIRYSSLVIMKKTGPLTYKIINTHEFKMGYHIKKQLLNNRYMIKQDPLRIVFNDGNEFAIQ